MESERKRILERVKNGELSVEEAEAQLASLERRQREQEANDVSDQEGESFNKAESDETASGDKKFKSVTDKLVNLFDQAVNKIKEMDLDFYNSVDVSHVFQQNDGGVSDVYIDVPNGEVTLSLWNHTDVRIECEAKVYREDDPEKGKERFLKDVECFQQDGTLRFKSNEKLMKVKANIYIPEKAYRNVYLKMVNGPISCERLKAEKLDCKTINGKVRLVDCGGKKGEIETVNGQVTVINGNFNELEAETVSGKVNVDGEYEKLDVETIGGTIMASVKNSDSRSLKIRSLTGTVYVKVPKETGIYGELKSHAGTLQVDFDDILVKQQKKDFALKHFVFEKVNDGVEKVTLYAESKTGSVFVQPL